MLLTLLLLQAAAGQPDIQFGARVRARSVTIEQQGEASLTVRAEPDAGSVVDVRAPKANGRKKLRNVEVDVRADVRLSDPAQGTQNSVDAPETTSAPPR